MYKAAERLLFPSRLSSGDLQSLYNDQIWQLDRLLQIVLVIKYCTLINLWLNCLVPPQGHPELESLKRNYLRYLSDSQQEEKAGEVREQEGDFISAVNMYLHAGLPAKAARLCMSREQLLADSDLIGRVTAALIKGDFYERVSNTI